MIIMIIMMMDDYDDYDGYDIMTDDYYDYWVSSMVNKGGKGIFYKHESIKKSERVEKNNKNKK